MRHAVLLVLGLCPVLAPRLAAQWSVALEAAVSYYGGGSRDMAADPTVIRPHHPALVGLRLDRRFGRLGLGVAAALAGPDVVVENSQAGTILKNALDLYEIAPEAMLVVGRTDAGVALWVHAGPLIDIWSPDGGDTRTRVGGHAGLSLECPLGDRFAGSVRAAAALTGSLFEDGELPGGFEPRAMWRRSVSLGLRYRL